MNSLVPNPATYLARRELLRQQMGDRGVLLFLGHAQEPINYGHNVYRFRQDSSFLYFFGIDVPNVAAVIRLDDGLEIVFGTDGTADEQVWSGRQTPVAQLAAMCGVGKCLPFGRLATWLVQQAEQEQVVHYLRPYRASTRETFCALLRLKSAEVDAGWSRTLTAAVIAQREIKDPGEIEQIEGALGVTREMHLAAMRATRPGVRESAVVGEMDAIARRHGAAPAYASIFSRRGEILHNESHSNVLEAGDLVVNDTGVSSPLGYASDITRTLPVGGRFSPQQRGVYELVLQAQEAALQAIAPGRLYRDVHGVAAGVMARGLVDLGICRGDPVEVLASGAYAVCFPHGLGHAMGLDVHDMESLGEDLVGYDDEVVRDSRFGPCHLRMAKRLKPHMVLTVEPGLYFIPQLIESWRAQARFAGLIDYDELKHFVGFGGIRIEDDIEVTAGGCRVLGPPIPKTLTDIEAHLSG